MHCTNYSRLEMVHKRVVLNSLLIDVYMQRLQRACFGYFQLGGRCVSTPVGLLAGLIPEPLTLMGHFFAVAVYGTVLMFMEESILLLPFTIWKCMVVLYRACVVFFPLLYAEFM